MREIIKYIEWDDKFSVGVNLIDKQHKHFVNVMNDLFEAMQFDKKDAVSKIIDELVAYANVHFATEEKYFDKYNYEGTEEHKAEHRRIQTKVNKFLLIKDSDPFKVGYSLLDLLEDWLFKHIITMDKKYIKFFDEHGIH